MKKIKGFICPRCGKGEIVPTCTRCGYRPKEPVKLQLALDNMTPTQRRRYSLYLQGWTLTAIAQQEMVSINSAHKSIKSAKKRAKNRLAGVKKG